MTAETIEEEIRAAIPKLMEMAKELTWNKFSDEYLFLLSTISDKHPDFIDRIKQHKRNNDRREPKKLQEVIPELVAIFNDLYDINLTIYIATKKVTIIEISYYAKSQLEEAYRKAISTQPPMIHCKVAQPPWLSDKKQPFDINWQHKVLQIRWKMFIHKKMIQLREILPDSDIRSNI